MENPYRMPETAAEVAEVLPDDARQYGGIRRLPYWVSMFLTVVFRQIMLALLVGWLSYDAAGFISSLAWYAVMLVPIYYRLKNIGSAPWYALFLFIPLLNLLLLIRCAMVPEGYAHTKKLDRAGYIMAILVLVALAAAAVVAFYSLGLAFA